MKSSQLQSLTIKSSARLDAKYFLSPGVLAAERMRLLQSAGVAVRRVGGEGGFGSVAPTTRTKRTYAGEGEAGVPYLRPYDVFDYLPQPADLLSKSGSEGVQALLPTEGTILQTCSGRNLGPLAYADKFLASFAVSDDMLRLTIDDPNERAYVLTFLMTPTGQALLTRNKTGAVIDHLSADDLRAVGVPLVEEATAKASVADMRKALDLRERARVALASIVSTYEAAIPTPVRGPALREGWTVAASGLRSRLDAANHDPLVTELRNAVASHGGVACGDVADAFIPGRYTRYYVEPEHGRPIVSGRQLLQAQPVNLRYIAPRSFDYTKYVLAENMVAFGAEGRAEERLGYPALVTADRSAWLANNHVMRVLPKDGTHPGWLYLAFATRHTLAQVKAMSCGSVVDTVYPEDLRRVILPPPDKDSGDRVLSCWHDFEAARRLEEGAVSQLEAWMVAASDLAA